VSVALFIQYTKRMRHIILASVAGLAVACIPHHLINGTIFANKNYIEYKMCFFPTTFVRIISHSKNN